MHLHSLAVFLVIQDPTLIPVNEIIESNNQLINDVTLDERSLITE